MPVQLKFWQPISPHKGKTFPFGDYNGQIHLPLGLILDINIGFTNYVYSMTTITFLVSH